MVSVAAALSRSAVSPLYDLSETLSWFGSMITNSPFKTASKQTVRVSHQSGCFMVLESKLKLTRKKRSILVLKFVIHYKQLCLHSHKYAILEIFSKVFISKITQHLYIYSNN